MTDEEYFASICEIDRNLTSIREELVKINSRLDRIETKQERDRKKLGDLQLDVRIAERDIRRDIHKLNDEMETVIEILRQKRILPYENGSLGGDAGE